jgi:hypothetical protein
MTYKEAKLIDVDIIAEIHSRTFNNFFLTSLGMSFLKTYYKACIKSKEAISLCSLDENNNIVGFCFAAIAVVILGDTSSAKLELKVTLLFSSLLRSTEPNNVVESVPPF